MKTLRTLLLCLIPAVAIAGGQVNLGRIEEAFFCEVQVNDATVAATSDGISCNFFTATGALVDATTIASRTFVPANRDLLIEDWGLIVLDVLGVTEVCPILLVTDNTTVGAGSTVSTITTNGATNCDEGAALDLDVAGETCTIAQVNQIVLAGGHFRFEFTDGGACTVFQSGALWVRGQFLP